MDSAKWRSVWHMCLLALVLGAGVLWEEGPRIGPIQREEVGLEYFLLS